MGHRQVGVVVGMCLLTGIAFAADEPSALSTPPSSPAPTATAPQAQNSPTIYRGIVSLESLTVAKGQKIHYEGDTVVECDGELIVNGIIQPKAESWDNQGNAPSLTLRSKVAVIIRGRVTAENGLDGIDANRPGGRGGSIIIEAPLVVLPDTLRAGFGGNGGPNAPGGKGGDVLITAQQCLGHKAVITSSDIVMSDFVPSKIVGGHGGHGGPGQTADHDRQTPRDGSDAGDGGDGGHARVLEWPSRHPVQVSATASFKIDPLNGAPCGARDEAGADGGVGYRGMDAYGGHGGDGGSGGNARTQGRGGLGGRGGRGGDAQSGNGGPGGAGGACCKGRGGQGGSGGSGGDAFAGTGGRAGHGGRAAGNGPPGIAGVGGNGGSATGGTSGRGGPGGEGKRPGSGGTPGQQGFARGGEGGKGGFDESLSLVQGDTPEEGPDGGSARGASGGPGPRGTMCPATPQPSPEPAALPTPAAAPTPTSSPEP